MLAAVAGRCCHWLLISASLGVLPYRRDGRTSCSVSLAVGRGARPLEWSARLVFPENPCGVWKYNAEHSISHIFRGAFGKWRRCQARPREIACCPIGWQAGVVQPRASLNLLCVELSSGRSIGRLAILSMRAGCVGPVLEVGGYSAKWPLNTRSQRKVQMSGGCAEWECPAFSGEGARGGSPGGPFSATALSLLRLKS